MFAQCLHIYKLLIKGFYLFNLINIKGTQSKHRYNKLDCVKINNLIKIFINNAL